MPDFRFLSSASVLASHYSASVSSVPCFLSPPHSGFLNASVLPFGFSVFHLLVRLVSHASFPVSGTWLSVCFLSSFPASLPQLFYRCFPIAFAFGLFPCFLLSFVRFLLGSDYSASALSVPCFPLSPGVVPSVPVFPLLSSLFPCLPSGSGTWLAAISFLRFSCFASQRLIQVPSLCFRFRTLPLACALGSGYLAGMHPEN